MGFQKNIELLFIIVHSKLPEKKMLMNIMQ